jgi:hypothetical protein
MNVVTSTGKAAHPTRSPRSARGTRPGPDTPAIPPAGQPGHGLNARLRRQPVRIVDGRIEGGYTDAFEVICPDCGDHQYLDYGEVIQRLQRLRGPRTLEAALAEYERHLGLTG